MGAIIAMTALVLGATAGVLTSTSQREVARVKARRRHPSAR
jgi:hypothetical protein